MGTDPALHLYCEILCLLENSVYLYVFNQKLLLIVNKLFLLNK